MRSVPRVAFLNCVLAFAFTPASGEPIICDLRIATSCTINSAVGLQPTGTRVIDEIPDPNFTRDLQISEVDTNPAAQQSLMIAEIPEPGTLTLVGMGLLMLTCLYRKRT
jgi:hypothetical protein